MSSIRLVAFDLDGTLVDSMPDIVHAVDSMVRKLSSPIPDVDKVREWVGDGVRRLVERALTGTQDGKPDAALYRRGLEAFRHAYAAHIAVDTRVYPGVREVLDQLQDIGIHLACITNKSGEFTEPLLNALDLRDYFGVVLSGDSLVQRKPDPMPLLHAAHHFKVAPQQACMVGDSRNDLVAARAAGFRAIGVRYGYGGVLADLKPDAILDSLTELPPLLEKWGAGLAGVPSIRNQHTQG
ncbi:MAG: phosphoglycolate phosphatase [Gammaproteobacteria bacterium]